MQIPGKETALHVAVNEGDQDMIYHIAGLDIPREKEALPIPEE